MLAQSSQTLLDKAGADRPAGLDTAFLAQVETQRTDYVGCDATQTTEQSDAQQDLVKRQAVIDSIRERRQRIQLAAEFLWPSDNPAHAPLRREFGLPPNRPYLG